MRDSPCGSSDFERALISLEAVLGKQWVQNGDTVTNRYCDPYSTHGLKHGFCRAAVMPGCTEEVRAVVRVAAACGVPIWPISRGQNLGYGGSAALVRDSIVVDLSRMNRIIEIDVPSATCVIEPGVGFEQLFNHLQASKIPLWPSIPGNPLGSVIGNALERGVGRSPYGEHSSQLCGLEVVLPTGDLVRTGMGAMANSATRHRYGAGFGPSWDQMFVQSNFGIVTRAGMLLQLEPEATMRVRIRLPEVVDLGWAVDLLAELRLRRIIEHPVVIGNYLHDAAVHSIKTEWFCGHGSLPPDVASRLRDQHGLGWWNFSLLLFGHPDVLQVEAELIRKRLAVHLREPIEFEKWERGDPLSRSAATMPDSTGLKVVNWMGGDGGHINCAPVLPADGKLALAHARRCELLFERFGIDYCATFVVGDRHVRNVNTVLFRTTDFASTQQARLLCESLIADARDQGFGEYRAHIDFMQSVADTFDFDDHALRRLNERLKDAIDPAGILAPGKNGIWPRRYREN